ncbi:MAG: DNA-directed RNA polymerase subunit omega [Ruminococcaceae bacterium]|nr:DNA-directed RNA polymerase subunit omega [Oscillospiraceae bacterium]
MIIKPGISTLEKCVDDGCRYVLVTVAAKRARMLAKDEECLVACESENPVTKAVTELASGKIGYKAADTQI